MVAVFLTRPFFAVSCWEALEWPASSSWRFLFLVLSSADLDFELSCGCCCGVLWNWGRVAEREGSVGALGVLSRMMELSRRGRSSKDFWKLRNIALEIEGISLGREIYRISNVQVPGS